MKCTRPRCPRGAARRNLCMPHWRSTVKAGVNGYTDIAPMSAHVTALMALGWSYEGIARASGVSATAVRLHSRNKRVWRSTARAVLAIPLRPYVEPSVVVSSIGLSRRRDALALMGWPLSVLAPMAGTSCQALCNAMAAGRVSLRLHDAFAAVYDRLISQRGPSNWVAARARNMGYQPAIAWEYADIDDPAAKPFQGLHKESA